MTDEHDVFDPSSLLYPHSLLGSVRLARLLRSLRFGIAWDYFFQWEWEVLEDLGFLALFGLLGVTSANGVETSSGVLG